MCERLGLAIAGFRIQRDIDLQTFGTGSLGETPQLEVFKDGAQPDRDLAALNDVRGWSWVEIEHHHPRTRNISGQRERRVQLDSGQIGDPNQRGQIVHENVIHIALIAFAPYGYRLYPVGTVLRGILFEEELLIHAARVSLER